MWPKHTRELGHIFTTVFRQQFDQEWLIPIMTYLFSSVYNNIFSIMYYELFWLYLQNMWLSHI